MSYSPDPMPLRPGAYDGSPVPTPPPGPRPPATTAAAMSMAVGLLGSAGLVMFYAFAFALAVGALGLAVSLFSVVLVVGVLKGHTWARVTAFIYYGCGLFWTGMTLVTLIMVERSAGTGAPLGGVSLTLCLLSLGAFAAVIVSLALPGTSRWFEEMAQARRIGIH